MPLILFLRSRGATRFLMTTGTVAVLIAVTPSGLLDVPLIENRAAQPAYSLFLAVGCFWGYHVAQPAQFLEFFNPQGMLRVMRLIWITGATTVATGTMAAATSLQGSDPWDTTTAIRNTIFGMALGTICGLVLRRQISWLPPTLYLLMTWFVGTRDLVGTARWWALPQQEAWDLTSLWFAICTWLISAGLYVFLDGRAADER